MPVNTLMSSAPLSLPCSREVRGEGLETAEISTGRSTAGVLLRQQGSVWPARVGYTRRGQAARRSYR
jgi:hypothetical protein